MASNYRTEKLVITKVTYTLFKDGQFNIVENAPARVVVETGELLFSPNTVERLHEIIPGQKKPARTIQTPFYDYS